MAEKPVSAQQVQDLADRSDALAQSVKMLQHDLALVEEIAGIEKRTTAFEEYSKGTRKRLRGIAALILVLIVLGGGILGVAVDGRHTAQSVDKNAKRIQTVECQFYGLVLSGGYHPENHLNEAGLSPAQSLSTYNNDYEQVINENNTLGCVKVVPPHYITNPNEVTTTVPKL